MQRLYGRIDKATKTRFAESSSFEMSSTPAKDTPLHLPYNEAFHGWWRRELPYHLLRASRKLHVMFGPIGTDTVEYLELVMSCLEETFVLSPRLAHLIDRADPTPADVDGVWIQTAIWPERAKSALRMRTWHRADVMYRLLMRTHALQTQSSLKFDYVEHALMPVLQLIAIPRLQALFYAQAVTQSADTVARMAGEQLLFDCWFMLQGVQHPLAYVGQHLRRYGAFPILFDTNYNAIVLIAKPPAS